MKRLFFLLPSNQKIKIVKKAVNYLFILLLFSACTKKDIQIRTDQQPASKSNENKNGGNNSITVTTFPATIITSVTANLGGSIVSGTGNGNGITRGICYNTSPGPTTANSTAFGGSGSGNFVCTLAGLIPNTVYYARAYAIKNSETTYGNEVSFTTLPAFGTVTDIDGNIYNTITIGTQTWTLENIKTTHYRDGSPIPHVTDNTAWSGLLSGAYCDYNNAPSNSIVYGKIYNLYAAKDPRNIAPEGWHVPSVSEWNTLINYLGGSTIAGGKLKEAGLAHWLTPNAGADNGSGFTALPGGVRGVDGTFFELGKMGYFLSVTNFSDIYYPILNYNNGEVTGGGVISRCIGGSVRCIKD